MSPVPCAFSSHGEPAVLALAREAVLEHDHGRDDVGALHVADVEALDAQRCGRQAQLLLQFGERTRTCREVRRALELVLVERLRGVARDGLGERSLVTALRHAQPDPAAAPFA